MMPANVSYSLTSFHGSHLNQ